MPYTGKLNIEVNDLLTNKNLLFHGRQVIYLLIDSNQPIFYCLFSRSFLLQLMVRFGLVVFLKEFIKPLVEGVGSYQNCYSTGQETSLADEEQNRQTDEVSGDELQFRDSFFSIEDSSGKTTDSSKLSPSSELSPVIEGVSAIHEVSKPIPMNNFEVSKQLYIGGHRHSSCSSIPLSKSVPEDVLLSPVQFSCASNFPEVNFESSRASEACFDEYAHHDLNLTDYDQNGSGTCQSNIDDDSMDSSSCDAINSRLSDLPTKKMENKVTLSPERSVIRVDASLSEVCRESIIWLSVKLGPVLTAKYLSRNLLKMISICYLPSNDSLSTALTTPEYLKNSVRSNFLHGDVISEPVFKCLGEISSIYGQAFITVQYFPHMIDIISASPTHVTESDESCLLGSIAFLRFILPYLTDQNFVACLEKSIIKLVIYPLIRMVVSSKSNFSSGSLARSAIAYCIVDAICIICERIGSEISRKVMIRSIVRLLSAYERSSNNQSSESNVQSYGGSLDYSQSVTPEPFKEDNSSSSLDVEATKNKAFKELTEVFSPEFTHFSYSSFCRVLGSKTLADKLPNAEAIRSVSLKFERDNLSNVSMSKPSKVASPPCAIAIPPTMVVNITGN